MISNNNCTKNKTDYIYKNNGDNNCNEHQTYLPSDWVSKFDAQWEKSPKKNSLKECGFVNSHSK